MIAGAVSAVGDFAYRPCLRNVFLVDAKVLADCRSKLLASRVGCEIDFSALSAVWTMPMLPKNTLMGLLETLLETGNLIAEWGISLKTREAVAVVVSAIYAYRGPLLVLKTAEAAIAMVIASALLKVWYPLLLAVVAGLIPLLDNMTKQIHLRGAKAKFLAVQLDPAFIYTVFASLVAATTVVRSWGWRGTRSSRRYFR
jgi:hypothetical protein